MRHNIVETILGAVVLLVAGSFIFLAYKSNHLSTPSGYNVRAKFTEIGSLNVGSDVRLGGIKVGTVTDQSLDPESYMAILQITLSEKVKLPKDSSAAIVSDGLLGSKYVAITPGADDRFLGDGGDISFTQDAISLESLIAKFAFGSVDKDE